MKHKLLTNEAELDLFCLTGEDGNDVRKLLELVIS